MKYKALVSILFTAILAGCGSTQTAQESEPQLPQTNIPDWVFNPFSEKGLAVASCVEYSENFNIDRNQAEMQARIQLMQSLDSKVSVLEKSYQKINKGDAGNQSAGSFEQIAKTIADGKLQMAVTEKTTIVDIAGKPQMCVLMSMPTKAMSEMFDGILDQTDAPISPDDKAAMYKEFMAQKAEKALESQTITQ
ncbi:hypothetical protein G5S52_09345 [Grimontia sp. S25]|uniref:Lipoprotein n=1 Tax=Grimontia sedimenti TaxID=2711294 RepID=A0A6M1RC13_9GAMM|nr:hypothetical protein [Grimontia sedimenti]NGN97854.1 hypothetical protein [Grimontia sedimenti]